MRLNTLAMPGDISTLEEFVDRAIHFDWYTDMSDDHRVYQAGRRRREALDVYAANNPLAAELWKKLSKAQGEGFMAGQLITRVNDVVHGTSSYGKEDPAKELKEFVIGYLARHCYTNTMLSRAARDAIAKQIEDCPKSYQFARKEEREEMIEAWIDNWVEENV